jgi:hypothetical protein|nr:MAG TPA: hypothetical protein [Crassvirales sp.]
MAHTRKRIVTPRITNSKSNPTRSSNRANPMIPKAGFTKSGRRSFENGGKFE